MAHARAFANVVEILSGLELPPVGHVGTDNVSWHFYKTCVSVYVRTCHPSGEPIRLEINATTKGKPAIELHDIEPEGLQLRLTALASELASYAQDEKDAPESDCTLLL